MTVVGVDPQPALPQADDMQARLQAAEAEAALRAMRLYKAFRKGGFWFFLAVWGISWGYVGIWLAHLLGLPMPWS